LKKLIYKTCSHLNIAEILRLSTNHWNAVDLWARDSLSTRELLIELYNIKIQLSVLVTKHTIIVQSKCKLVSPRYNCGRSRFTNSYILNNEERPECITWKTTRNAFPSWQDSLFLRSKSEGTGSLDQMSYRSQ
jgi:hypothetical protein